MFMLGRAIKVHLAVMQVPRGSTLGREVCGWLPEFLEENVDSKGEDDKSDYQGDDHQEEDEGEDQDDFVDDNVSERIPDIFQGEKFDS
ncbi:hypothetical protein L6452_05274 [Arctium lappa]|uniref:Uncharacterized protein n=1 Tax=Arctium lappa TaxID=4217 RepID=A0ACB9EG86_ARCLA|nr:hypothetical protein L6452_05274 [Arctium lappa]